MWINYLYETKWLLNSLLQNYSKKELFRNNLQTIIQSQNGDKPSESDEVELKLASAKVKSVGKPTCAGKLKVHL